MKILVTCPPMINMIDEFREVFQKKGIEVSCELSLQKLSEDDCIKLAPKFDGWIIGDEPVTRKVLQAGKSGRLKAAVRWGIGMDNIDLSACRELGFPLVNTPGMFGQEVADNAMGYLIALARDLLEIDKGVKSGKWPKPSGITLAGKTMALVGYGDIGRNVAKRAVAFGMKVVFYDPFVTGFVPDSQVQQANFPDRIAEADFIVFTCALTPANRHMFDKNVMRQVKHGVRVVNVARGPLIDTEALVDGLRSGKIHSAGLDVFEEEPLPLNSALREFGDRCIFGSHNSSNTVDAVSRASLKSIELIFDMLGIEKSRQQSNL